MFVGDNSDSLFPKASLESQNKSSTPSTTVNRQKTQTVAAGGRPGDNPRVRRSVGLPHDVDVDALPLHELGTGNSEHKTTHPRISFLIPPEDVFLRLPPFQHGPSRTVGHTDDYPVFSYDEYEFVKPNREDGKLTSLHATAVTLTDNYIPEREQLLMNESASRETSTSTKDQETSTALPQFLNQVLTVPGVVIGGQCECSCPCLDADYRKEDYWFAEVTESSTDTSTQTTLTSDLTESSLKTTTDLVTETITTEESIEPETTTSSESSSEFSTTTEMTTSSEFSTSTELPTFSTSVMSSSSGVSFSSSSTTEISSTESTSTEETLTTQTVVSCTVPPPMILILEGEKFYLI